MNAIINFLNKLFAEETTDKPKMTLTARKNAALEAINRGLLRNHGDYGTKVIAKMEAATKLRKLVAESYARRSESMLANAEYSIKSFERVGLC